MSAADFPCASSETSEYRYDFDFDEFADQSQSSDVNLSVGEETDPVNLPTRRTNAFVQRIMAKKSSDQLNHSHPNQPEKRRVVSSRFARKPIIQSVPIQQPPPPTLIIPGRRLSIFDEFESQTSSEDEPIPDNPPPTPPESANSESSFFSVTSDDFEEETPKHGVEQFLARMDILRDQFFNVRKRIDSLQEEIEKLEEDQTHSLNEERFDAAHQINSKLTKSKENLASEMRNARQIVDSALLAVADAPAYLIERTKASQEELPQLQMRHSTLDKRLLSLVKQQQDESNQIEIKEKETELAMREITKNLEERRDRHEEMVRNLRTRIEASQEPFREKIRKIGADIEGHKQRIQELKAEIEAHEETVARLEKDAAEEKEKQRKDLESYKQEEAEVAADANEIIVKEHAAALKRNELEAPYKELLDSVARREKEISAVRSVLERIEKEISDSEKDRNECDRVIGIIHGLSEQYKTFRANSEEQICEEERAVQNLADIGKRKTEIEVELAQLKGSIERAKDVVSLGNQKMPELENNKKNAVAVRNFKGAQLFSQQLKDIQSQIAEAEKNISEWLEKQFVLEAEFEQLDLQVGIEEKKLQSQKSDLTKCTADFYLSILKQLHTLFESAPFATKLLSALHDLVSCAFEHSEITKEMTSEEVEAKLVDLNEELERAVAHDDFDAAQLIQDKIDRLESQLQC